ncbi:MAG TPA: hypothetical protein VK891_12225 [Euzebyales bacterium]|nr:hypothetical protein [Euzebyales bacterium]
MQFDPNFTGTPPFEISGDITAVRVLEGGVQRNRVVDPTKSLDIEVDWEVDGGLTNLWLTALASAQWRVSVHAESQGAGDEKSLGEVFVPIGPLSATLPYRRTATISVPAPVPLQQHSGVNSGVYKLTVTVFLNSSIPGGGFDMIGFAEGPYIQVENPA